MHSSAVVCVCLSGYPVGAQTDFEDYRRQQDQDLAEYREAREAEFAQFIEQVTQKWEAYRESTRKEWYDYSHDLNTLSKVDFEAGEVTIETLVEESSPGGTALAEQNVADQIRRLHAPDSISGERVLDRQLVSSDGKTVNDATVDQFIKDVVLPKLRASQKSVKSRDGVTRRKLTVSFALVPDHLEKRIEQYLPLVKKNCERFDLEVPLVLAMIQTESYFNPRAKSSAPAYGLMQLVPTSGGRDAFLYVYHQDKVVSPAYLYRPDKNIELGCGYLAKLRDHEFRNVSNPDSQRFCMVASYNTGPGNLSKAVCGTREVGKAVGMINRTESSRLYEQLVKSLPYAETRDYLQKVESRRMTFGKE